MARFEEALQWWVLRGKRARRQCWARMPEYTRATPPMFYERVWQVWLSEGSLVQGWGGQIGFALAPDDPIRDGTGYTPSDEDRVANDWEVFERHPKLLPRS